MLYVYQTWICFLNCYCLASSICMLLLSFPIENPETSIYLGKIHQKVVTIYCTNQHMVLLYKSVEDLSNTHKYHHQQAFGRSLHYWICCYVGGRVSCNALDLVSHVVCRSVVGTLRSCCCRVSACFAFQFRHRSFTLNWAQSTWNVAGRFQTKPITKLSFSLGRLWNRSPLLSVLHSSSANISRFHFVVLVSYMCFYIYIYI
jgi:hypothetical protein